MKYVKYLIGGILIAGACLVIIADKQPSSYWVFYMRGQPFSVCTAPTLIPYTTAIADAVDFTPVYQNSFFTTPVWGPCPYTTIYRSEPETTMIIGKNE